MACPIPHRCVQKQGKEANARPPALMTHVDLFSGGLDYRSSTGEQLNEQHNQRDHE